MHTFSFLAFEFMIIAVLQFKHKLSTHIVQCNHQVTLGNVVVTSLNGKTIFLWCPLMADNQSSYHSVKVLQKWNAVINRNTATL